MAFHNFPKCLNENAQYTRDFLSYVPFVITSEK